MATPEIPPSDDDHIRSALIPMTSCLPRSWINVLPDELISDILVTASYSFSGSATERSNLKQRAELPLIAQVVCRRWMYVVRYTQALWTSLDIKQERPGNCLAYFKRSGVLPLDVNLEAIPLQCNRLRGYQQIPDNTYIEQAHQTDIMLHDHAHRIRKLSISGLDSWETDRCIRGLPVNLVNLHELMVSIGGPAERGASRYHLDLHAPQLRSLSVYSYSLNWSHMRVAPDLEELLLTDANTTPPDIVELVTILWSYRKLRKVVLYGQMFSGRENNQLLVSLGRVTLEGLEILSMVGFSIREIGLILGLLEAPRLGMLQLIESERVHRDPWAIPVLHFPLLDTLSLEMKPGFALEIAKQVPSVRHLTLQPPDHLHLAIDAALESLFSHWQTLPSPLFLETLMTKGARPSTLLSFLETSQEKVVPSLQKVSIHYADAYPSESGLASTEDEEVLGRLSAVVDLEMHGFDEI